MPRAVRFASALVLLVATIGLAPTPGSAGSKPLWVRHVENYPGGISVGVRAKLAAFQAKVASASAGAVTLHAGADDHQINTDCDPPLPQDETSVAVNTSNPLNVVAAANDFCGDGFWIGHSTNGGASWTTQFKDPKLSPDSLPAAERRCFGSDPSVVYSAADSVFYLATLCFSPSNPSSEVQVWQSTNGAVWTDSVDAAVANTNIAGNGSIDGSVFYDKELLAIDNNPVSPHFGRLYATFIKFHMTGPSGRSDYCPVQLAFTDPSGAPNTWTWSHTAVVPDAPGTHGLGASANQWAMPVVDEGGGLDIAYAIEECNTGFDSAFFLTRSINGGASFTAPVRIDKAGQFADNPNRQDRLPNKKARIPISPSLVYDSVIGLVFAYQNNIGSTGADISLQTSGNFGATWSDAVPITTVSPGGAPAPGDQFFPWLVVQDDPDPGDPAVLHAVWYDQRNDPTNDLIETFVGTSTDGGDTWSNTLISDVAWDPDDGFFNCGCFIGDYNGMALGGSLLYPVWTDGQASAGRPLGETDIFAEILTVPPPPP
jgi:hypothetical protein